MTNELWFYEKIWKEKFFFWNQSINIVYPNEEKVFLWPNHEKKHTIIRINVFLLRRRNFNFKKMVEGKAFLLSSNVNVIYPNKDNVFTVPNHEKKRDYYLHPCISELMDKFWFQKTSGKERFCDEAKVSVSFIPIRKMCLWCLIMKRKEIITSIHVCPTWRMNFYSEKWLKKKLVL